MEAYNFPPAKPLRDESILFFNGHFAVACGYYKGNGSTAKLSVGLRYTGKEGDKNNNPYPRGVDGKGRWFILDNNEIGYLRSLVGQEHTDDEATLKAIQTLIKQQPSKR